ncbi:radical SAM/SPASM domain-containing protein [Desulfobacula sp.]|uniref:radical SAM/SPASM domain-containing protein n=1 Tax=Desulfobacula sp. TaxID=2593537 RepID=UPI00261571FD|nr:radical SAM/SPASM domain-containing protein [Desulfobacula sp.]
MKARLKSKLNLEKRTPLQDVIPLQTPFLLYLDPSSACNFRCQFCPTGHKDLIDKSGYRRGPMSLDLFEKTIQDLSEFNQPLKVLRMNKVGEPFLNKNLSQMVALAKRSGSVEFIDLTTNGSLFSPERLSRLLEAGLDRLNISLEGMNREQYRQYAKVDFDFDKFVKNVKWLYSNKGNCEVTIKIPGNYINDDQKEEFLNTFGNYCDRIFIEDIAPIWPSFDIEAHSDITIGKLKGQYEQSVHPKGICSYIFYSAVINSDGSVSACCPDWAQKLIVGNVKTESLKNIWHSSKMNNLRRQHLEGKRHANNTCSVCGHLSYCQVDNIDPFRELLLNKFITYEKECLA